MKYTFTGKTKEKNGIVLKQILANKNFADIKKGDIGGWIEKRENLSQDDDSWIFNNATAYENARICGNAIMYDDAKAYGNVRICGDARICGNSEVYGDTKVCGNAIICGDAIISNDNDYMCFQNFGSRSDTTTVFKTQTSHNIKCGCFEGNVQEFERSIKNTHGNNRFAQEYLAICEVIKIRIKSWE